MTLFSAKKTDIDLLARYNFDPEKQEKRIKILTYTLPGALVIVLIAALIIFNLVKGMDIDDQIKNYDFKIALLSSTGSEADEKQNKNITLNTNYKLLSQVKEKSEEEASKYSYLGSELLHDIKSVCGEKADLKLMDFSAEGILFTFQTASLNYSDISVIVNSIESFEYFDEVTYTGYSKVSDEAYSFCVVCSFKSGNDESEVAE